MTEALATLLATFAVCADVSARAAAPSIVPATAAYSRVAWDPETQTWGAPKPGAPGADLTRATSLGGPELPFEAPVEFALPGGGRGWALGRSGMEMVRVVRGADGRFHTICEPSTQPSVPAPAPGPTDR